MQGARAVPAYCVPLVFELTSRHCIKGRNCRFGLTRDRLFDIILAQRCTDYEAVPWWFRDIFNQGRTKLAILTLSTTVSSSAAGSVWALKLSCVSSVRPSGTQYQAPTSFEAGAFEHHRLCAKPGLWCIPGPYPLPISSGLGPPAGVRVRLPGSLQPGGFVFADV